MTLFANWFKRTNKMNLDRVETERARHYENSPETEPRAECPYCGSEDIIIKQKDYKCLGCGEIFF